MQKLALGLAAMLVGLSLTQSLEAGFIYSPGQTTTDGVTVRFAVYDNQGTPGDYTGDAGLNAAITGTGRFLYLYQISSALSTMDEAALFPIDVDPVSLEVVTGYVLTDGSGSVAPGATNVDTAISFDGVAFQIDITGESDATTALFGFTSDDFYTIGTLQTFNLPGSQGGGSVSFDVPVPDALAPAPSVPEPGTLLMSALALIGGGYAMRRRVAVA